MDPNQLPEGFDSTPQQAMPSVPEGFDEHPPQAAFPVGFDASPTPEGFTSDNPVAPAKTPPVTSEGLGASISDFWQGLTKKIAGDDPTTQQYIESLSRPYQNVPGTAFVKGVTERVKADTDAARLATGTTLPELYEENQSKPQDEVDRLLQQKLPDGFLNPSWWGAQIAHGTGSMVPGLGAATVGGLAGPVGSVAGFTAEAGIGSLVPAFIAAKQRGLDDDAATKAALTDSGISAATAAAMGIAPQFSIFGKTVSPEVTDQVAETLKHPVMEALTQLGLIQPSLATVGHAATTLSHGEVPGIDDLATTFATGVGMGVVPVGFHAAIRSANRFKQAQIPSEPAATPEEVQQSFQNQQPRGGEGPVAPVPPEGFELHETDPEAKIFYSPVLRAAQERLPASATPEQVIATLRNTPGVKEEELLDLNLPGWLADRSGKVNKDDLIAHIESNAVRLEEVRLGNDEFARKFDEYNNVRSEMIRKYGPNFQLRVKDIPIEEMNQYERLLKESTETRGPQYASQVMPGEHSNYREFVLKVPERGQRLLEDNPNFDHNQHIDETNRPERERIDNSLNYTDAPHFEGTINPIAHFRVTDRVDRDGRNLLHVEEIQSDLHQAGRKQGYLEPGEKRVDLDELEKKMDRARRQFELARQNNTPYQEAFRQRWRDAQNEFQAALGTQNKLPDLPFKTSWQELAVKRILRLAADEGYDGVSWSNGDQVGLRLQTPEQLRGARENYDQKIPKLFQKWAKKLGADIGTTQFEGVGVGDVLANMVTQRAREMRAEHFTRMGLLNESPRIRRARELAEAENGAGSWDRIGGGGQEHYIRDAAREGYAATQTGENVNKNNGFVTMNPAAGTRIRMGLPLYETPPVSGTRRINDVVVQGLPKELERPALKVGQIIRQLGRDMDVSRRIFLDIRPMGNEKWRGQTDVNRGAYRIRINTTRLRTPEDLYATAAHELGHVIQVDKFEKAKDSLKLEIYQAFENFKKQGFRTVGDVRRARDNPVSEMTEARNLEYEPGKFQDQIPLSELTPKSRAYIRSFEEWFAEQTAKWATTSSKPLSRVDKFFKALGAKVRQIVTRFLGYRPKSDAEAVPVIQKWLDQMLDHDSSWSADLKDELTLRTKQANQEALDRDGTPEIPAAPQTSSSGGGRDILANLPSDGSSAGPAMAAHADRMNRFYEWMTSLPQIAELNKHIRGLQTYREIVGLMNLEKNNIMGAAKDTLDAWKRIRDPKQLFALNKFIEDYANGMFKLTPDGVVRRPTAQEFAALASKHKLSSQSLAVFDRLVRDFDGFLEQYRGLLLADARRIKDPKAQAQAIADANARVDKLLSRPFFPLTRFGKYTITVYDTSGNIRHFEQTDSLRKQAKIKEALEKSPDLLPGDRVRGGEIAKDAAPLLGMPPGLLDALENKLNLSGTQRAALDQLRFDYAPSQSFRHQFRSADVTPGYSTDFQRAYAHFFFHGANHVTRIKWVDALRDQIREVKRDSILLNDANKRDAIANYMTGHLDALVDPKPDFAALRGLMFHWFLGFNPASATLNLSQTALMTHPHLASKFGDLKSLAMLARVGTDLNNFYKKGTIKELAKGAPGVPAPAKLKALAEAVKEGVISETQAHTLAAVSEDRNLLRAFGSKGEEFWQKFSEASSWMFEMTEQYNRRVAFRAAWELAMRDPNNRYVSETVRDNPLQYQRLIQQGWSHQEAAAFTAAKDSVEKTQFVYAPYARPKFMWGRKGAAFIFKSFVQNTLFNLWANKPMAARSLLIMGVLGGLMGLPGTENVKDILKNLAFKLFGKDFDIEDEVRKFVHDVTSGKISPDLILHGTSKYGFGIPQVLDMMGHQVGVKDVPFPVLDRSSSIGMGDVLGFDPTAALGPTRDPEKKELAQLQRAAGAGFGLGFAMYNFLKSQQNLSDLKRWEIIMPKAIANASKAARWALEGGERNQAGNKVVRFDVHDTEQLAEILARAAGYQPRRLSAEWERIGALAEQKAFWQIRQGILLRQFGEAVKGNNTEDRERVLAAVRQYNSELPEEARGFAISRKTLLNSVRQRLRVKALQESGRDVTRAGRVMEETIRKYFPDARAPEGTVDARPVR